MTAPTSRHAGDAPAATVAVETGRFPCSATQERCWFLDQLNPGTRALNVAVRWNVQGRLSAAALEGAFRDVIARHEILRTRFEDRGHGPEQVIMESSEFRLSEIDIRTTPAAEQAARVETIATESASLPFNLSTPELVRATLIRLSNDRAILAITIHQICFDGWSIRNLGREIGECAAARATGTVAELPELPLQYADYALWQRAYFDSPAFSAELAACRERLAGAPYFELQPDFPRPLSRSDRCAMTMCDLPPAFGERLEEEARRRSMSPFAYGAGVLSAMLATCAGTPEVTIGTQTAGRTEVDLEPLIGAFINNVVMRFPTPADVTINEHLGRAKVVVQQALMSQHLPFNKLVETLNPPRDPSRTPLISVNFILQPAFMETVRYGEFELSSAPSHAPGAIYDLSFVLIGRSTGWRMTLEYNSDLFTADRAEALLDIWRAAFGTAFETPEKPITTMPRPKSDPGTLEADARRIARIEASLAAHPQVGQAAVVQYSESDGTRRIHAFVSPASEAPLVPLEGLPASLADHLLGELEEDGQPDAISVLRALPQDAEGRFVRAQLPLAAAVMAAARSGGAPASAAPDGDVGAIEARLMPIWSELLGLDKIPPNSSFFDLGGHSLLTVRMLARIEQEFGKKLSLATAYHSPTLRALARHLSGRDASAPDRADWRVLRLNEGGQGIPLIAINNAQTIYALANGFARERPVFAVRIHDAAHGTQLAARRFEEIAADYVDAVRSAQPHGPYALFGNCVHGNLALEVARQLQQDGEQVAAVVMKDVWEPSYAVRVGASRMTWLLARWHFLGTRLRFLRRGDISLQSFLGTFRAFRGPLRLAVRAGLIERVRHTDLDAEQEEFIAYLSRARDGYRPDAFDGRVLHFVTSESPSGRGFEKGMGWERVVTGNLETVPLRELSISQGRNVGIADAAQKIEAVLVAREAELGLAVEDQRNAR
ncbi:condensation domain-containing protein (plasmid) [Salipiger sp. H15]|uniref:Condensation domain-containing protein n=1 Tax=Alloyangia sp. H15 TaxID=3029062 RepID=A0AAU8AT16_9RHOB